MFYLKKKLGGYMNCNFEAVHENKKYIIKFQYPDCFCNRDLEIKVKSIVNKNPDLFNTPRSIWNCRSLTIEEFIEGNQVLDYDQLKAQPATFGKKRLA